MTGNRIAQRLSWIKWTNWEYWPSIAFYWPMFVYGPLLALRYRHPCFFSAANPSFYISGFGLESKYDTVKMLPEAFRPLSVWIEKGTEYSVVAQRLEEAGLHFPLIAKPDLGYRGLLVTKIETPAELEAYLATYPVHFLVQEFLDFPEEVGVFYARIPGAEKGRVISLTLKKFLQVVGDGKSTVRTLVQQNPRALMQLDRLAHTLPHLLETIPDLGVQVDLGIVGNHSKGTQFINGSAYIDAELSHTFEEVAQAIPGFYYGRFDIKCRNLDLLKQGKDFKIIELNGICSEPTHIYDQHNMSYPKALWTIIRHWTLVGKISSMNHRAGAPYFPTLRILRAFADLKAYMTTLKNAVPK